MGRPRNPFNTLHKVCPTCKKEFTCEKRKEKTYCCKSCSANSEEVKEKNRVGVKKIFDEKYGGHPMSTNASTRKKFNETMIKNHGVDRAGKMPDFLDKIKRTLNERYGSDNYNNLDQMKRTMIDKYGVDNYRKTNEYDQKYKRTCLIKYGVENASRSVNCKEEHKKLMFKKFIFSDRFKNFTPEFNMDEYQGATEPFDKKYPFKCNRCGRIEDHYISDGKYVRCSACDKTISEFQLSIYDYIKSLLPADPVVNNDRTSIYPQEIDVYLPTQKIGIECDGLYWHAEVSGSKNKNYHLNKTKYASSKGIRMIHIFENEWNCKKDIVKSILRNVLTKSNKIVFARKCVVSEITSDVKKQFLNENHVQGNDHCTLKFGLYLGRELVSVMTFVRSRFDLSVEWEMSRFCSKIGINVVGGSSKIFSHFVKLISPRSIVSYSDRRFFSGEVYLKLGFSFIDNTSPNYFYTLDGYCTLSGRQGWQKSKLKNKLKSFDPSLSEWENMKMNGFDRIWDCGHSKWIWRSNIVDRSEYVR